MLRVTAGILLLLIAGFMTIGYLAGGAAEHPLGVRLFAMLVSVGIPAAGGFALLRGRVRVQGALDSGRRDATWESELVALARRRGGRLTVVEAVAEAALSAAEAEATLTRLVESGVAEPEVTEKGLIVYVFPDVARLADKNASRGLLDG